LFIGIRTPLIYIISFNPFISPLIYIISFNPRISVGDPPTIKKKLGTWRNRDTAAEGNDKVLSEFAGLGVDMLEHGGCFLEESLLVPFEAAVAT